MSLTYDITACTRICRIRATLLVRPEAHQACGSLAGRYIRYARSIKPVLSVAARKVSPLHFKGPIETLGKSLLKFKDPPSP
jgi:hypothetical protein